MAPLSFVWFDGALHFVLVAVTCAPRAFSTCLAFSYTGIATRFSFPTDFTTLFGFT